VPAAVIVAIIGVETIYGRQTGGFRAIDALATLAFDYPRDAELFRRELESLFLLAREQGRDPASYYGSFAGALGYPQFLPSSVRAYALDFDGNGSIDFDSEARDAIGSVANYLKGYGWIAGQPIAERVTLNEMPQDLGPHTLTEWSALGVVSGHLGATPELPAKLLSFSTADGGEERWLVFNNFEVITRYNNSNYYAMSVTQLAERLSRTQKLSSLR